MTDIEIARNAKLENIQKIANDIGLKEDEIELYGKYKAKITEQAFRRLDKEKDGNLILVSAMSPTPLGEGKTTISIAIADGLNKIGKKAVLALREPSLGPVFGVKGGATGGGQVQVAPMEDINLHFTGDIHAITAANNLLSAMIDNHIYHGNELKIKEIVWDRCVDLNDRQLRVVDTGLSKEKKIVPRRDGFNITVASEIMAILCLSNNLEDLKTRLGNIIIAYNEDNEPIYAKDLKADGSMLVLLKDALNPNLVQTLNHTPTLIHGGPFANIAHGCNSIRATKMALKLGDYAITEAGFGADLGAEKFLDIKSRKFGLSPKVVVIVATIKALKYHGGASVDNIFEKNDEALAEGMKNLYRHINNMKNEFGLNVIVALNKFNTDTEDEINYLKKKLSEKGVELSLVEGWAKGAEGAIDIAEKIVKLSKRRNKFNYIYKDSDSIQTKLEKVATKIYGAEGIVFEERALNKIKKIEKLGKTNYPVCIAKTQFSFSADAKNLKCDKPFKINFRDIQIKNGAEMVVALAGKIMTMPGLPKIPAAETIDIDDKGNVVGLF